LTEGSSKPGNLELRQALPNLWRRCAKEPLHNLPLKVPEVITNLDGICKTILITQVSAMRCVVTRMGYRELQKTAGLQDTTYFGENAIRLWNVHEAHETCCKVKD